MTPAERRALLFLAFAAFLGASVRVVRGRDVPPPDSAAQRALALQIAAVDSARAAAAAKEARRPRPRKSAARESGATATRSPRPPRAQRPPRIIDLDEAPAALIDSLPGIGPVIASRIVADRDRNGPFGSLEGLQRVKGIGPAMARKLAPYVTFSGRRRPNTAHTDGRGPADWTPRPADRRQGRRSFSIRETPGRVAPFTPFRPALYRYPWPHQ